MKGLLKSAAAAAALIFLVSGSAEAQLLAPSYFTGIDCGIAILAGFPADDCSGAIEGNNEGGGSDPGVQATLNHMNTLWGTSYTEGSEFTGGSVFGEFVLALKGADYFSLFYFANHDGSALDLGLGMSGVAQNPQGGVQGLSHATVYGGTVRVPEPGTMLLLGTGLLGLAMARRREDVV